MLYPSAQVLPSNSGLTFQASPSRLYHPGFTFHAFFKGFNIQLWLYLPGFRIQALPTRLYLLYFTFQTLPSNSGLTFQALPSSPGFIFQFRLYLPDSTFQFRLYPPGFTCCSTTDFVAPPDVS